MTDMILILGGGDDLDLMLGDDDDLELVIGDAAGSYVPPYEGAYEVTPNFDEQVLETNGKRMTDDVTVHVIPVTWTTNIHGGQTVVIG